jgi:putative hydrolase of the HAD superfamily
VTTKSAFDVLLFDLGGVLIDFAGFEEMRRLLPEVSDRSEIRDRWIQSESVQLFERGDITPEMFARRLVDEFHLGLSVEEFIREFVSWARGPYPGAASLLNRLRSTHRIACLSNSNELHTPIHRASIHPHVDSFYFSDGIGLVKPDREIFDHVIRDLAVSPRKIAFFDDTPVNIEAAREVGLTSYLVDGIAALKARLRRLGLFDRPSE